MARRTPLRKVTYFEPVPARLARNTIIESTFRRFRYRIALPGAVIWSTRSSSLGLFK